MKELITHIEDKQNDEIVYHVEELCKRDFLKEQGLNYKKLADDFIVLKQLTEKVNEAAKNNPGPVSEFKPLAKDYFRTLEKHKLKDWLINPKQNKQVRSGWLVLRYCLLIMGLPLYVAGLIGNYIPLVATHKIAKKSIKNIEFYSSIAIGAGMFIFWISYILVFIVIYQFSPTVFVPLIICFTLVMCGYFNLYYYPFMKKTHGMARILKNKEVFQKLSSDREKLISLINKF